MLTEKDVLARLAEAGFKIPRSRFENWRERGLLSGLMEARPDLGQGEAACRPHDERHTQFGFKPLQVRTHHRFGYPERLRRTRERSCIDDRHKADETIEVDH